MNASVTQPRTRLFETNLCFAAQPVGCVAELAGVEGQRLGHGPTHYLIADAAGIAVAIVAATVDISVSTNGSILQGSAKKCADFVKQQRGRARQKS